MLLHVFVIVGPDSRTIAIEVEPTDTVEAVKDLIAHKESLSANELQLTTIDSNKLRNNDILEIYNSIQHGSTLLCTVTQRQPVATQIFVETFSTEVLTVPVIVTEASVSEVKRKIAFQSRFAAPLLSDYGYSLAFAGNNLDESKNLCYYNIKYGSTLKLKWSPIQVIVKMDSGQSINLNTLPIDAIKSIKASIEDQIAVPSKKQQLLFEGDTLEDNDTLFRCGINDGCSLQLHYVVSIDIRSLTEVDTLSLEMVTPLSIEGIKAKIQPKGQYMYFAGQLVQDDGVFFPAYETDELVFQLSRYPITFTSEKEACSNCSDVILVGDGIKLANCSHIMCRFCTDKSVKVKEGTCVVCEKVLSPYEICSVLDDKELAVKNFPYRFYCKTEGCPASCFFEDKINEFHCYACMHASCMLCSTQHETLTCREYQDMLHISNDPTSRAARQNFITLLKEGRAIQCPQCMSALVKKFGCSWLCCNTCKMNILVEHLTEAPLAEKIQETVSLLHKGTDPLPDEEDQTVRISKAYVELLSVAEARRIVFIQDMDRAESRLLFQAEGISRLQAEIKTLRKNKEDQEELIKSLQKSNDLNNPSRQLPSSASKEQPEDITKLKEEHNQKIHQLELKKSILVRENEELKTGIAEAKETKHLVEAEFVRILKDRQLESEEVVRLKQRVRELTSCDDPSDRKNISWLYSHTEVVLSGQELGRGAFGVVYAGNFQGQSVAIKQMYQLIVAPETRMLLDREINLLSQLRHPNLVQFIGAIYDHPSGSPIIITEIMDTSLRKAYENKKITPDPSCRPVIISIMRDVAVGLNYLHSLCDPIIHRDVSSANVLLESKGPGKWKTKISDFGSANLVRDAFSRAPGAEVYSAPECSANITSRTTTKQTTMLDVFSFGVLFCEVLTCRFPILGSWNELLQQVYTSTKKQKGLLTSSLHHELINSCCNKNPTKRPTMKAVITKLDELHA